MGAILNFIDIWLKLLGKNDEIRSGMYKSMKEMFKTIPTTMSKPLSPKQKDQKLMTEIVGGWYMGKSAKGLPAIRKSKLRKKIQYKEIEIKLYADDKWWNDWKLQLYWHKLEWVNPRNKTKRIKTYSVT